MFLHKEQEETLKGIVETYINTDFAVFRDSDFSTRADVLSNALSFVRNMTIETEEDAAFRAAAVGFCDNLLLNMANDPTPFGMPKQFREVYTLSVQGTFTNQELIKEKNLNGYFLSKLTGGEHHFAFGSLNDDYSFLRYVSDIDFPLINPDKYSPKVLEEYIVQHANTMDILILPYPSRVSAYLAQTYRNSRQNGKLIITADTNRQHISAKFQIPEEYIQPFFTSADVVTVASGNLRDMLNSDPKNKFPAFSLTHAFANATGEDLSVSPSDKENIILSAGRLDIMSKNTAALVNAFARASELIPDWKLVLAGGIHPALVADLLKTYPQIKNRIEFLGELDKASLYRQYKRAKIFAMASVVENQPNVCSEAMAFGCYQVLSDSMDGAEEITRGGEFGVIYEQERYIVHPDLFKYAYAPNYGGEAEKNLANALIEAAHKLDYNFFKTFIPKSKFLQQTEFDYNNNARKLALLMFA
jgi:glycosyltransferase involved in cell wall biosynthesis